MRRAAGCDGLKDIPINFYGRHQLSLRLVVVFVVFGGLPVSGIERFDAPAEDLIKQLQFCGKPFVLTGPIRFVFRVSVLLTQSGYVVSPIQAVRPILSRPPLVCSFNKWKCAVAFFSIR